MHIGTLFIDEVLLTNYSLSLTKVLDVIVIETIQELKFIVIGLINQVLFKLFCFSYISLSTSTLYQMDRSMTGKIVI